MILIINFLSRIYKEVGVIYLISVFDLSLFKRVCGRYLRELFNRTNYYDII